MALLNTAAAEAEAATAARRPIARIWRAIVEMLDGDLRNLRGNLVWMCAHTSSDMIWQRQKSNGLLVTAPEWRANQLADKLAKQGAQESPLSVRIDRTVKLAQDAILHAAAQLGCVTLAANSYRQSVWKADGTCCTVTRRDSSEAVAKVRGCRKRKRSMLSTDDAAMPLICAAS